MGPQTAPTLLAATGALGKSHGAVAVSADDDVLFVAWNASGPYLYAWRPSGELAAVVAGPPFGADIMSDSFDPLVLGDGLAVVHLSYYNNSCDVARCSVLAAFRTPTLEPAWSHYPSGPLSSSVMSRRVGLVTLSSRDRALRVLAPATGELSGAPITWYGGSCDSSAGLAADASGEVAFVACGDATFGHSRVLAFDLVRRTELWTVEHAVASAASWPPPLAYWAAAASPQEPLAVVVTDRIITGVFAANGSAAWAARLPTAACHYVLDFALAGPLLYVLAQADDAAQTIRLLAYNSSGLPAAAPAVLPLRVDRFLGSLLADPDGVTVYVNGWDALSRPAGALKVVAARLNTGSDGIPAWTVAWTAPPAPAGAAAGRYTSTGAQRANGSLVFAGWQGAFLYGAS